MKTIINKIKAIFENMLEYIGFHYVGYKVDIEINAKEIKAIKDELKALKNSRIVENFNIQFDDINDKLINIKKDVDVARCEGLINKDSIENIKDSLKMLRGDIKVNKNNIDSNYTCIENLEDNIQSIENRLDYEMDFINEDQLHEAFYDFKQENIKNGELHELRKKVEQHDNEIEDIYHDQLVYGDYNKRMDFEERLHGLGIDDEGDLSGYNEFKKEQEKYFNSMDKFETQLIQDKKEKAVIKHIKDMLNNNKKHNELIENLLNELCELNNLKEDK